MIVLMTVQNFLRETGLETILVYGRLNTLLGSSGLEVDECFYVKDRATGKVVVAVYPTRGKADFAEDLQDPTLHNDDVRKVRDLLRSLDYETNLR